ncbi:GNAT family N-acetyltransferase [uncultured Psychrobacter sp.]|uniref:GNAT family N-acetyltransferase n=1 Tax=Psychrobacter sp. DM8 TaxID=3440636 RepID=UPI00293D4221|nr:GNAT family N-acetyltransferase [uncultured Psychrobacter sp.]
MNKIVVSFRDIDEKWDQDILNYRFDIYHLSGWINNSASMDGGQAQGIVAEYKNKKLFLPIIIRNIDSEYWDATSTYGYCCPLIDDTLTDVETNMILKEVKQFLYKVGCVSLFMRLHPVISQKWTPSIGSSFTHGVTLMSDLTKTEAEHWAETQNQHRRGIKKALKMDVTTKIEQLDDRNIDTFSKIYKETMTHVNADEYYFFDDSYFDGLSKNLGHRLLLITAYKDGHAIASSIYTCCKESGIMQFHLGGTVSEYRHLQPSKLITHVAREWGRQNNYKILHLGGGVGSNLDTLYEYKKGFSSQSLLFKTYRLVINQDKYDDLVDGAGFDNSELDSDFFPLYRQVAAQKVQPVEEVAEVVEEDMAEVA